MKRLSWLLAALALAAPAHAEVTLKRLFNTAGERAQMDAARGQVGAPQNGQPGAPAGMQPGTMSPPGMPATPGMPAAAAVNSNPVPVPAPGMPPDSVAAGMSAPGMPPSTPPGMPPSTPPGMPPAMPGMPGAVAANATTTAPDLRTLTLSGVLRTSSGASTVWLNGVPQDTSNGKHGTTVTLPSGKRVVLRPGQRFDLNDGSVKDVSQQ